MSFLICVCLSIWRRLAARFMWLGGWKGVDCLASPSRLKNIGCHPAFDTTRAVLTHPVSHYCSPPPLGSIPTVLDGHCLIMLDLVYSELNLIQCL
jgi:hypothetical protein